MFNNRGDVKRLTLIQATLDLLNFVFQFQLYKHICITIFAHHWDFVSSYLFFTLLLVSHWSCDMIDQWEESMKSFCPKRVYTVVLGWALSQHGTFQLSGCLFKQQWFCSLCNLLLEVCPYKMAHCSIFEHFHAHF